MCDLLDSIADDWQAFFRKNRTQLDRVLGILPSTTGAVLPPRDAILRAFEQPIEQIRVLIVGQDPYPTPGHAMGLAFSVSPSVQPLPRTLRNIFIEYQSDLELPPPTTGDLSPWAGRGVFLLNRVLTVSPGVPGSHRGIGWEGLTEAVVQAIAARGAPLVTILWGKQAGTLRQHFGQRILIESAHPSPLSATKGFFGSRPFSRANVLLEEQGASPVDWRLA
jgi:uracil-DNA glycosylase